MKTFFSLALITIAGIIHAHAQKVQEFQFNSDGSKVVVGDSLQLVTGSNLNRREYAAVFIDQSKITSNTPLTNQFDGYEVCIKELKYEKRNGVKTIIAVLSGLGPFKSKCYLQEAFDLKEIALISRKSEQK